MITDESTAVMDQSSNRYRALFHACLRQMAHQMDLRPRRFVTLGLAVSLWLALVPTFHSGEVPHIGARAVLASKEDMYYLYNAAKAATWSDVPKWWVGPWNWPGVPYYRPITSMLYFFEYRLFGDDFTAYNRVSWVVHGINTALLYLLVVSLFRERKRARWILGYIAVWFFARADATYGFAVGRTLSWFPAQNDSVSLLFSLLCLLLLDVYLTAKVEAPFKEAGETRLPWQYRLLPAAALLFFFFSVGSKEMGYITMPMALLLIWHRGSLISAREITIPYPGRVAGKAIRLPSALTVGFALFAAALWLFRRTVVPHAWGPEMWRGWIFQKLLFHWSGPFWFYSVAGIYWPLLAGIVVIVISWLGLRRKWPVWMIGAVSFIAAMVCAQFGGQLVAMFVHGKDTSDDGSWALLFDVGSLYSLGSVISYVLALLLFWKYRRCEPGLFAAGSLALVFIPILQYGGRHYFYWPGAFIGIADSVFCACLYRRATELHATANWTIPQYVIDRFYGKPTETSIAAEKETVGTQA